MGGGPGGALLWVSAGRVRPRVAQAQGGEDLTRRSGGHVTGQLGCGQQTSAPKLYVRWSGIPPQVGPRVNAPRPLPPRLMDDRIHVDVNVSRRSVLLSLAYGRVFHGRVFIRTLGQQADLALGARTNTRRCCASVILNAGRAWLTCCPGHSTVYADLRLSDRTYSYSYRPRCYTSDKLGPLSSSRGPILPQCTYAWATRVVLATRGDNACCNASDIGL